MGINPTPTNHRSFTFDGKSTREFGVYITGKDVFNAPERAVEMISIPGRDGEYALDQGHFNNIEVTYRAGIVADSTTDFAEAISNFRNWLASREGYCRLTDEYNTEEYRMAVFKNAIALEHEGLLTGEFDVTFDCKPQRYLAIGEELVEIGAWGNTETAEGEVVTIDASSDTAVKALTADIDPIQDLHGYDAPWVGGAGKNKLPNTATSQTIQGVAFTVNSDGSIKANGTSTGWNGLVVGTCTLEAGTWYMNSHVTTDYAKCYLEATGGGRSYATNTNPSKQIVLTETTTLTVKLYVPSGQTVNNVVCSPLIHKDGTTADYEPYSNICPISGWDAVGVYDDPLYGGFIEWNQIAKALNSTNYTAESGVTVNYSDEVATISATTSNHGIYCRANYVLGHKYYIACSLKSASALTVIYGSGNAYGVRDSVSVTGDNEWHDFETIKTCSSSGTNVQSYIYGSGTYSNLMAKNFMICDLTAMFGSGKEPSTVAEFKELFPNDYYAYDSGTKTIVSAVSNLSYEHYTTTLPSTTYGGTLDVVSGLLTVTHGFKVYDGSENWRMETLPQSYNGANFYIAKEANVATGAGGYKCNILDNYGSTYVQDGLFISSGYWNFIIGNAIGVDNVADFKTWLSTNNIQLMYPLATPQTYQLTPQQVELLLGENNIFADSGNVTVEYGHNPTLLTNPTWFPSKPLLAVEGYGEIKFNNRSIVNIESGQLGNITIANNMSASSIQIDESLFNIGDTVTVSGAYKDIIINLQTDGTYYNIVRESDSITDSNSDFSTAFLSNSPGTGQQTSQITYRMTIPSFNITIGTDKTITDVVSGTISCKAKNPSVNTFTATFSTTREFNYNASTNTITGTGYYSTVTTTAAYVTNAYVSSRQTYYGSIVGNSTVSKLGNPTYIDCDIGEAYMVKDGEPISLNQYIDLGSDLPTLPPGDTEVTYDNTITKVEVKPNWWKV